MFCFDIKSISTTGVRGNQKEFNFASSINMIDVLFLNNQKKSFKKYAFLFLIV